MVGFPDTTLNCTIRIIVLTEIDAGLERKMAIRKQEFYEGAALHRLVRSGHVGRILYEPPFFYLNGGLVVLLKYSTKGRSPWGFTFTADEQKALRLTSDEGRAIIGLVCGADGVAAFTYEEYQSIAAYRKGALHVACYRSHGEHYEVIGPDGVLARKVAPSAWQRILSKEGFSNEA